MKPLKRKTLIKLKNGRHRAATTAEARALVDVEQHRKTARLARAARDEISNRLRATVTQGVAHALTDEDRRYAISKICGEIAIEFGRAVHDAAAKALGRDGMAAFQLTAEPRPFLPSMRFNGDAVSVMISAYVPAVEWCIESPVR